MAKDRLRGKVVIFSRPKKAEIRKDVLLPPVDENTVVIKTKYSGISRGTEMDLYHDQMHKVLGNTQWYPMIPGYEPVGEVIEVGKNVKHLKKGDRAATSNLFAGYDKNYCIAWGGQAEYIVVNYISHPYRGPERVVRIPEEVSYQEAALSVLAGVALHGIEKVEVKDKDTVMVIGQGVVGMCSAQIASSYGARVIVSDLYDFRLNISKKAGIDKVINAQKENQLDKVLELTKEQGPDIVIETTGEAENLHLALKMVKENGKVHAQGMYLEPIVLYIPDTLFIKNLSLSSSCGEMPEQQIRVLDMIAKGKIKAKEMISKVMSVDEAPLAYELVHKSPDEILKIVLSW